MIKVSGTFGITEATQASKFATTPEQRRTVLATLAMLGVKNTLIKKFEKYRGKAADRIMKNNNKIAKLIEKKQKAVVHEREMISKLDDVEKVKNDWTL